MWGHEKPEQVLASSIGATVGLFEKGASGEQLEIDGVFRGMI